MNGTSGIFTPLFTHGQIVIEATPFGEGVSERLNVMTRDSWSEAKCVIGLEFVRLIIASTRLPTTHRAEAG
ncbi:hypothetical protein ACIBI9_59820 [Nonomuraea sp. NPDC050451]|uniref:hypothetical protein n=1 Tax=Nonomuraea sp. NPDC050451 TaxID=3364364 RepID=UPI0037944812